MSDKPDKEKRGQDRRKGPRRPEIFEEASRAGSDQRPKPLEQRVRDAWRQILDRRHEERRVGERRQPASEVTAAAAALKAEH